MISAITAVNFVGQSSTVVDHCFDRRLVRVWDASSLPPDTAAPAGLRAWMQRVTTAGVDGAGTVASPPVR